MDPLFAYRNYDANTMSTRPGGILRTSSHNSSSTISSNDSNSSSEGTSSPTISSSSMGNISQQRQKPIRRNVGKVERVSRRKTTTTSARQNPDGRRSISFNSKVAKQDCPFSPIPRSKSSQFYYDPEEIARFRHAAFLEDAGLDPEEFPYDG